MAEDEHKEIKPGDEHKPGGDSNPGKEINPLDKHIIEEREKLEKDYVPREKYEEAVSRFNNLTDEILKKGRIDVKVDQTKKEEQPVGPTDEELRAKLTNSKNAEFWEAALELRQRELKKGHPDIFVTSGFDKHGRALKPEPGEEEGVERNCKIIQQCLDIAKNEDGTYDNTVFNAEMTKRAH